MSHGRKYPPVCLSANQVERLWREALRSPRAKDRAIVVLLWRAGLRVAEVCSLQLEDVDIERRVVVVRRPKGWRRGKPPRIVGVDEKTLGVIHEYVVKERGSFAPGPLIMASSGRAVHTSQVRRTVSRLGHRAALGRVHPHGLRHTFATELYREGVELAHIQAALGHENLITTGVYLQGLGSGAATLSISERKW